MKGIARSLAARNNTRQKTLRHTFNFKRVAVEVKPSCCKMQKCNSNPFTLELLTGAHLTHEIREGRKANAQGLVRPQNTKRHWPRSWQSTSKRLSFRNPVGKKNQSSVILVDRCVAQLSQGDRACPSASAREAVQGAREAEALPEELSPNSFYPEAGS